MSAYLSPLGGAGAQFFSNQGVILSGGKLYSYIAGSTTPQATWTDNTQAVQNANPIILSSSGRPPSEIWLAGGTNNYKFILTDSTGAVLGTWDNITGIAASNAIQSEWVASNLTPTYISATQFSVPGDQTAIFTVNRRLQYGLNSGTFYAYISAAAFSVGATTVTIVADSTGLDATLSSVNYGFINPTNTSIPHSVIPTPVSSGGTGLTTLTANNVMLGNGTGVVQFVAPGAAGRVLTSDGSTWTSAASTQLILRSARTSNTILASADVANLIDITSGTFTQTFTAAATLGSGWYVWLRNSGTGNITLDPNGAELIDGLASYIMYPNETRLVQCNGTAFTSCVLSPFKVSYTTAGTATFTTPPGYVEFGGKVWSGGQSGQRTNATVATSKGGHAGGAYPFLMPSSLMGASQTITVGAGGAAVSGVATGNVGGDSSIGSLLVVKGATNTTAGAVSGLSGASASQVYGFQSASESANGQSAVWGGGTASSDASSGSGNSIEGGAAGGGVDGSGNLRAAGTSLFGGNGGAASIAGNGTAGAQPGGGGGATQTGTQSGKGGDGKVEIWGIC